MLTARIERHVALLFSFCLFPKQFSLRLAKFNLNRTNNVVRVMLLKLVDACMLGAAANVIIMLMTAYDCHSSFARQAYCQYDVHGYSQSRALVCYSLRTFRLEGSGTDSRRSRRRSSEADELQSKQRSGSGVFAILRYPLLSSYYASSIL